MSARDEVEAARSAYGAMAARYDSHVAVHAYYFPRLRRFLRRFARPGTRVLDVGCGTGLVTRHVRDAEVIGLDLSPQMLALARAKRPGRRFLEGDFHSPLPTPAGKYDVIVAASCLEFCRDMALFCRNAAAALNPGGRLLFAPVHRPRRQAASVPASPLCPSLLLHRYRRDEVRRAIEDAGLAVVTTFLGRGWNDGGQVVWYRYWHARSPAP
ncbi:MAG TPA: class I SAM-dependent methyltransferase [Myxococcales bacterium]|nr:class I SAM-dependent methyltransferase [Myxococcales bacterium]